MTTTTTTTTSLTFEQFREEITSTFKEPCEVCKIDTHSEDHVATVVFNAGTEKATELQVRYSHWANSGGPRWVLDLDPATKGSTFREALAAHRNSLRESQAKLSAELYTLRPRPTMTRTSFVEEIRATLTSPFVGMDTEEEDDDRWIAHVWLDHEHQRSREEPLLVEYHAPYWMIEGEDGKSFAEAYCNYEERQKRIISQTKAIATRLEKAKG